MDREGLVFYKSMEIQVGEENWENLTSVHTHLTLATETKKDWTPLEFEGMKILSHISWGGHYYIIMSFTCVTYFLC